MGQIRDPASQDSLPLLGPLRIWGQNGLQSLDIVSRKSVLHLTPKSSGKSDTEGREGSRFCLLQGFLASSFSYQELYNFIAWLFPSSIMDRTAG